MISYFFFNTFLLTMISLKKKNWMEQKKKTYKNNKLYTIHYTLTINFWLWNAFIFQKWFFHKSIFLLLFVRIFGIFFFSSYVCCVTNSGEMKQRKSAALNASSSDVIRENQGNKRNVLWHPVKWGPQNRTQP